MNENISLERTHEEMGKNRKLILFAGTTEGRILAGKLAEEGISGVVCAATEYGKELLKEEMERVCSLRNRDGTGVKDSLKIRAGRLDEEEMEALIRRENASLVIDATHPYADQATANIRKACSHVPNVELLRCLREEGESEAAAPVREMASVKETVSWLSGQEGNILLTTGSKDLEAFSQISDFRKRVYVRVLPLEDSIRCCRMQGYEGRHIIAMQGPFSAEMNRAHLREYNCRFLVTKDGGKTGGFEEKLKGAQEAGAEVLVIRRPFDQGISLEAVIREVKEWKNS